MQPRISVSAELAPLIINSNPFKLAGDSKNSAKEEKDLQSVFREASFVRPVKKGISLNIGGTSIQRAISIQDYDVTAETLNMKMSSARVMKDSDDETIVKENNNNLFAKLGRLKSTTEEFEDSDRTQIFARCTDINDFKRTTSISGPPDSPTTTIRNGQF